MAKDWTRGRRGGISRLEWCVAGVVGLVLLGLVVAEPDVLEAPFENSRTMLFTVGATLLAAAALVAMVRRRVPPVVRILVLGVPFVATSWWLLSPFFVDDVVDEAFETSIAEAAEAETTTVTPTTSTSAPGQATGSTTDGEAAPSTPPPPAAPAAPAGPRLLGAGTFVGLAGHEGSGDAGFFALPGGSTVLRLERFDIENGPDLRLYVVPGGGRVSPGDGAVDLGQLRGNVGDQTYELPAELVLSPGEWTVLVWCEAFSVEFVAATVGVSA